MNNTQLLTFTLAKEVYAIEVSQTREVVEFGHVTPIPKTPSWIRGVLNLRGNVIPVFDLKQKFGMGSTERTRDTCVLILEITLDGELSHVGMLADSVREVIQLESAEIEPTPNFGMRLSTDYIRGVGRRNDELFVYLDIEKIFAADELALAQQLTEESSSPNAQLQRDAVDPSSSDRATQDPHPQ